jgi:hypothetical protein
VTSSPTALRAARAGQLRSARFGPGAADRLLRRLEREGLTLKRTAFAFFDAFLGAQAAANRRISAAGQSWLLDCAAEAIVGMAFWLRPAV